MRQLQAGSIAGRPVRVTALSTLLLCLSLVVSVGAQEAETQPVPQPPAPAAPDTAAVPLIGAPTLLLNKAMYHYGRREFTETIETLDRLLAAEPDQPYGLFLRALAQGQVALGSAFEERRAVAAPRPADAEAARAAAVEKYRLMRDDMDRLLKLPLNTDLFIAHLIDGVLRSKLAQYPEGTTRDERLAHRSELLGQARQALETYLHPPAESGLAAPEGLNRVRAEYFLGVVLYRQSLRPAETAGAPDELADVQALEAAAAVMRPLADAESETHVPKLLPEGTASTEVRRWTSYPTLYMGLIDYRLANDAAARGDGKTAHERFLQAQSYLQSAGELDQDPEVGSLSGSVIPDILAEHLPAIEEVLTAPVSAPVEDFFIEWRSGFAYDTNVILLGQNTPAPRGIGGKEDFRFRTGVDLGYTLDLAKIDPSLDRWTIGLLGRSSASWHGDIHEYNEQDYGGSAAVQYALMTSEEVGAGNGPLLFNLQYDYDYFLLGNNGFLKTNRLTPRLTYFSDDQHGASMLGMRYEDRNYLEELYNTRFDRDGNYFAFTAMHAHEVLDMSPVWHDAGIEPWGLDKDPVEGDSDYPRWLRPYLGFEYGWDSTRGEEYDAKRYLLAGGVEVPLPYGVLLDLSGQWEWQNYGGSAGGSIIDFHRKGRDDFIQRYAIGLLRRFVLVPGKPESRYNLDIDRLVMIVRTDVQFTDDDSNVEDRLGQAIFSYDRAIYGVSVSLFWN